MLLVIGVFNTFSQSRKIETPTSTEVYDFIQKSDTKIKFSDVENLKVTNAYKSVNSDITYVYYKQQLNGIPIFNSSVSVALKNGIIKSTNFSLISDLNTRAVNSDVKISLKEIEKVASKNLGYTLIEQGDSEKSAKRKMRTPTPKLTYFLTASNELVLSYETILRIATEEGPQTFLAIADASTGQALKSMNTTLYCHFENEGFSNPERAIRKELDSGEIKTNEISLSQTEDGGTQYAVFPLPVESPNHGSRSILTNPYDAEASPFGWHSEGQNENFYTFTAGNNTFTMYDHDNQKYTDYQNGRWPDLGNFVEGGDSFNFNFPLDWSLHPYENKEAIVTNLFYMSNVLHDIFYYYGFDEAAGNFQVDNYSGEGLAGDMVLALAQTGASIGQVNNASFQLGNDGYPALMSMFLWTPYGSFAPLTLDLLEIYTPGSVSGKYKARVAVFGPPIQNPPIYSDLVLMKDTNSVGNDIYDGCDAAINPAEIVNKIAVVRRGTCSFSQKVYNAQLAGAAGVIVVNNIAGEPQEMGIGINSELITIPVIMISKSDGDALISVLQTAPLSGSIPAANTIIPFPRDSSLDNGVISHEYGHGVSSRLTGGADNWCLTNLEQMGEGWSDFFALLFTMKPGDINTDARGVSNYVAFQNFGVASTRPTAYSTDMLINPVTYETLQTYTNTESSHGHGYVWASILWDMNWNLIEKYGFDPNIKSGNGGNNKALQLVIEGLKLQTCTPGFVDGRDAILQADELLYNGVNKCEIWKAFSRRGLGYYADQGSSDDRTDGTANFDMPPATMLDCSSLAVNNPVDIISSIQVFPNPTNGKVSIFTQEDFNEISALLWDASGKVLQTKKLKMNGKAAHMDISDKPAGVYILKIITAKGSQSFKVVKQ